MRDERDSFNDETTFVSAKTDSHSSNQSDHNFLDRQIGDYRIVSILGEGGMGTVFLGQQEKPVERKVAIKVIRQRFPDADILARFQCERQAVASLTHRNIAKLLEVGTTSDGRPYFAMELIEGEAITDFCDRYQLSVNERLKLLRQACDALAHAHSKGLIHRDIKPSNILVERENGQNHLKIIDFGLAKFVEDSASKENAKTLAGQVLGTPQYMSPEQAQGSSSGSDIRSDVFSIGVILFELLTGTTPISDEADGGVHRILSKLENFQPIQPSNRISQTAKAGSSDVKNSIAFNRSSSVSGLYHKIKGDLDWITLKALDRDQDRRYRSCNELSDDIRRYLNQEPILARPPSFSYLARKFVRKNRLAVSFASVVVLFLSSALIAGWYFAIWAMNQAESEKIAAQKISAAKTELERTLDKLTTTSKRATNAEKRSDAALGFLTNSFEGLDSSETGRDLSAGDAVWLAYQNSKNDQSMDRIGHIKFRITLAGALNGLGRNKKGLVVIDDALQLFDDSDGKLHATLFDARKVLHGILLDLGQYQRLEKELEESEKLLSSSTQEEQVFEQLFRIQRALFTLETGSLHEVSLSVPQFEKALEELKELNHPYSGDILGYQSRLAKAYLQIGNSRKFRELLTQLLKTQTEKYSENHPSVILTRIRLLEDIARNGNILSKLQKIQDSISKLEELYHETHPDVLFIYSEYLKLCNLDFQSEKVVKTIERILPRYERTFGLNHEKTTEIRQELAIALFGVNDYKRAIEIQQHVIENREADPSVAKYLAISSKLVLARGLMKASRIDQAIEVYQSTLPFSENNDHKQLQNKENALVGLSICYRRVGKIKKSIEFSEQVLKHRKEIFRPGDLSIGQAYYSLAKCFSEAQNYPFARKNFLLAIKNIEKVYSKDKDSFAGRILADCHYSMAKVWFREGDIEQCATSFTHAVETQKKVITQDSPIVRPEDTSRLSGMILSAKRIRQSQPKFKPGFDFTTEYEFLWNFQLKSKEFRSASTIELADAFSSALMAKKKYPKALEVCEIATEVASGLNGKQISRLELFTAKFILLERQATIYYRLRATKDQKSFQEKALEELELLVKRYKSPAKRNHIHRILRFCKNRKNVWNGELRETLLRIEKSMNDSESGL